VALNEGKIIDADGVSTTYNKITCYLYWPTLCSSYRKYIVNQG
jgi:hypothetical protein